MKRCARCGLVKDDSEFNWRWTDRGVRQSICRDCMKLDRRAFYEDNADDIKARAKDTKRAARERAQKFVYEYLSNQRCVDCGEYDFAVLTFDHVRGEKRMAIAEMMAQGYPEDEILAEISKCEVVCFNCHMRRENERRSGGRFRRFWPKMPWEE